MAKDIIIKARIDYKQAGKLDKLLIAKGESDKPLTVSEWIRKVINDARLR